MTKLRRDYSKSWETYPYLSCCTHCDNTGIEPFESSEYPPESCSVCKMRWNGQADPDKWPALPVGAPLVPRWLAVAGGIVAVVAAYGALWYLLVLACWDIADALLRAVGR